MKEKKHQVILKSNKNKRKFHRWKAFAGNIKSLADMAAGILWPEVCPFCGKVNTSGPCHGCILHLKKLKVTGARCFCCGKPVKSYEQEYCYDCEHNTRYIDQGISMWLHESLVKDYIYELKYHNLRSGSIYIAGAFYRNYYDMIRGWNPKMLIPIPLHKSRYKKRGYNQAAVLAHALGQVFGIPVEEKCLVRVSETSPQKRLDHDQRKLNLMEAFSVLPEFVPTDSVLLVDDIYTTGNTLNSAARLLKQRGVSHVYFLTISIGSGHS